MEVWYIYPYLDGMTVNITEILGDDFEEELKNHLEWFAEEFELDFNIENNNVTSEVTEIISENGRNISKTTREISVSLSSIPAELPELNEDTVPAEVNTTTLDYKVRDNIHRFSVKNMMFL